MRHTMTPSAENDAHHPYCGGAHFDHGECILDGRADEPLTAKNDAEALGDLIALHDAYRVNEDGWTVCICGHIAEGDDDDGSHARHLADVILTRPIPPTPSATAPPRLFTADEVIEIANETSDSLGNLYRLDFIDRVRHEGDTPS